jgi:hypothetical protein
VPAEVPVEAPLLVMDALLGVPNVPPPIEAGTVVSPAFCAADLNAASVSGPLLLNDTQSDHACVLGVPYSRWIDDPDHTSLAMSDLAAVVPDRVGIVDSQCEDLRLWNRRISTMLPQGLGTGETH